MHHAGGTTLVTVNQTQSQGQWVLLGSFSLASGAGHKVVLSDLATSGSVRADAIRFVLDAGVVPSAEVVVDNTSAGTVPVGTWGTSTTTSGFYGSNYAFNATGTGADSFTWPASVGSIGLYRVYARWVGTVGTIAPDAKYTVHHAGGTTTLTMNQKENQATWNLLGTFSLDPTAGHKVVLSDEATAGLNVAADAIRYVRLGDAHTVQADAIRFVPNTSESLLYVHADHLGTPDFPEPVLTLLLGREGDQGFLDRADVLGQRLGGGGVFAGAAQRDHLGMLALGAFQPGGQQELEAGVAVGRQQQLVDHGLGLRPLGAGVEHRVQLGVELTPALHVLVAQLVGVFPQHGVDRAVVVLVQVRRRAAQQHRLQHLA